MFNKNKNQTEYLNSVVRVIGDRASGKTTYMAALARWPNSDPTTSPVQQVVPINEEGERLIAKASNLLEQGEQLEPTPMNANIDDVKDYSIRIFLKSQFFWRRLNKNTLLSLNVNCKDYPGEFFSDLLYQDNHPLLRNYLEDCQQANGIMLLIDGMSHRQDGQYANAIEKFLKELDNSQEQNNQRRLAFVITKSEQPELWINRYNPQKLAISRFPKLVGNLKIWEKLANGKVEYFSASAFGMMGTQYPEPNMRFLSRDRSGIKEAVLKNTRCWKPFGLVAPIYWLCTGERHKQLDME